MQKRFPNGTFAVVDPVACSPIDPNENQVCSLQSNNIVGFYESSSWEYSWFVPHDMAYLITLMGGNVSPEQPILIHPPRSRKRTHVSLNALKNLNRPPLSNDWTTSSMLDTMERGTSHPSRHVLIELVHRDLCTECRFCPIQTPVSYHYANAPASSIDAVREAVFTNFDISMSYPRLQ